MKTTLDLPDDLVKAVKLRAVHEGKKLKDAVADLLRQGLASPTGGTGSGRRKPLTSARVRTDRKTGLPVVVCRANAPARRMTAQQLVALEQDSQTREDLERLGISD